MSFGPRRFPRLSHYRPLPPAAAADADLLARWAADRDEAAFELLVRRHSPVVLGVCRRLLSDPNDADDAFQATFLVLARKAGSIARAEVVAAWLHRVAYRAALRVRADRGRRTNREPADIDHIPGPPPADPGWAELPRVLDEEIGRLPARHRTAFILCCLEGKTGEEAGRLLGCPPGTVSSRLTRARERLRDRLTRRGFAPAAVAAALVALDRDAPAAIPANVDPTIHAALAFAGETASPAAPPTRPAAVAEGVLRTMTLIRIKLAALLVAAGLLAAGGLFAGTGPAAADPDQPPPRKAADEKAAPQRAKNADEKPRPEVRLVEPQKGGLDRVAVHNCTAEPAQRVDLYPAATGFVSKVAVDIGDRVKTGDVLAEISALDLELDQRQALVGVRQAESLLKEAEARVLNMKAEITTATATVRERAADAASAKADSEVRKVEFDNTRRLFDQKVVSKDELKIHENKYLSAAQKAKAADAAIETAKAAVDVAKSKLAQAEAAVSSSKASVEIAKIGSDKARLAVARTRVIASFDGVVTRRNATAGDSVRAGEAAGRPLLTLVRVNTVRVVVLVTAREAGLVKPGTPAELTFDSPPGEKFVVKVARIGYELDANGRMRVEIDLPNPDGKLRPGMSGSATLNLGKGPPGAVRVPARAVRHFARVGAGAIAPEHYQGVYVYRDGKARLVRVKVGYESGNEVEISSGLTAEDRVVADAYQLSGDEVPVRVKK